uniref:Uncharacterized protein n=1 Tax=Pithovirus LCDPAC01 TaxID=2506600 RepID=A0A481YQ80_9VIRU|nr:MAG: hypothetical protein LCDPAC01_00540 [Pithovirus LCDPAC01]
MEIHSGKDGFYLTLDSIEVASQSREFRQLRAESMKLLRNILEKYSLAPTSLEHTIDMLLETTHICDWPPINEEIREKQRQYKVDLIETLIKYFAFNLFGSDCVSLVRSLSNKIPEVYKDDVKRLSNDFKMVDTQCSSHIKRILYSYDCTFLYYLSEDIETQDYKYVVFDLTSLYNNIRDAEDTELDMMGRNLGETTSLYSAETKTVLNELKLKLAGPRHALIYNVENVTKLVDFFEHANYEFNRYGDETFHGKNLRNNALVFN